MQLVLKNGKVIATHDEGRSLTGLYPGCEVVSYQGDVAALGPDGPPDDPRTEAEKALAYKDKRRAEYPPLADQLDMIYWDGVNGTTTWKDAIDAIKTEYPKQT